MSPTEGDTPPLVPAQFVSSVVSAAGPAGAAWIERLPTLVEESCHRWALTIEGQSMHGVAGLVVPVGMAGGVRAVLKVSWPHDEAAHEADALRRWAGDGAVRLLAQDAPSWALLLERLDGARSLESIPDADTAVNIAAGLLPQLHVGSPPDIPLVEDLATRWIEDLPHAWETLGRPLDRAILDDAVRTCCDLRSGGPVRLLHGDFHYANVLAGARQPWLAIDPKPLAGDPAFEVGPLLRNRWNDLARTGDVAAGLRRRFDQIIDMAGLDRDRARAWAITRAVDNVLWATAHGDRTMAEVERTIAETLTG